MVTAIGIYVIRYFERWGRENITYFICFAAGVLILVSFLRIIPTAFSMNTKASIHRPNHYSNSHESPWQGAV
jgi:zinc and cadmium transporter